MGYYSREELEKMNFKYLGHNVMISKLAQIYSPEKTELGDESRVDDYCVLTGKIKLGKYVHIAMYTHIGGTDEGVEFDDHSECAYRCAIITHSSDYSLSTLHSPCVPGEMKNGRSGAVYIGKYSLIGYDSLVMPNVKIGEGTSVGAFSYVNSDLSSWSIYDGKPAKKVGKTNKKALMKNLERFRQYKNSSNQALC
ncbi:acetyltransferase-like isoleucine patch superfamily enzyme [Aequitasia blattaphilus]|uniref:Chloramphenicol acetyltransferase n=1 Tax=Aequitasia blattaphilus TaxID=2949332 RepID=A0ABT1E5Y4_9FIRM|nr:acyltransferase [Aequitasia blattaphilus]MCP1101248.1 acyltransferase [Aequitasia blattaphilus]MCR8613888.1 acyltransferase [Aequitasia blattaphilus]